jgi:PA14 domain
MIVLSRWLRLMLLVGVVLGLLIASLSPSLTQPSANAVVPMAAPVALTGTKLILFDGVLKPFRYRALLDSIDALPFDGVTLALQTSFQPFFANGINTAGQQVDRGDLVSIGPAKLKDSFALLWGTPAGGSWNWFDDAAWAQTETNVREIAKMVRQYGMKGVFFDPEPYEDRLLWGYNRQTLPANRPSFAEFQSKVFARGARFMQVLQEEAPGITVMTTRLFTDGVDAQGKPQSNDVLQDSDYFGLLPSFGAGMVRGANSNSTIIEGNERGYEYAVANDFDQANSNIASLRTFVEPVDRSRYDEVIQPGHPVYPDGTLATTDSRFLGFYLRTAPFTPAERATSLNIISDNTRNALEKSRGYAWVYLENDPTTLTSTSDVMQAIALGKAAAGTQRNPFTDQTVATTGRDAFANLSSLSGTLTTQGGPDVGLTEITTSDNRMGCQHSVGGQYFVCKGFNGWSGTLRPIKAGFRFEPPTRQVTNLVGNVPGFGFVAIPDNTPPTTAPPTTAPPTTAPVTTAPDTGTGSITRERWNRVRGLSVSDIPLNRVPDITSALSSFDAPVNEGDMYGQRLRGYLTAPATGDYRFWISGDDSAQLSLSTDGSSANAVRIAYLTSRVPRLVFNWYATQRSEPVRLIAGQRYYIEALMKEARGGDHLTVGWSPPGYSPEAPAEAPVPGWVLSPNA